MQRFHQSQLVPPPATSRRKDPYVLGLLPSDQQLFGLLDVDRICEHVKGRLR